MRCHKKLVSWGWVAMGVISGFHLVYLFLSRLDGQPTLADLEKLGPEAAGGKGPLHRDSGNVKVQGKQKQRNDDSPWALNDEDDTGGDEGGEAHKDTQGKGGRHEDKVFNPHPFKVIRDSTDLCKNTEVFLAVYVHTAPGHLEKRSTIRQTWGNSNLYDLPVRVAFIMGLQDPKDNTPGMDKLIQLESKKYKDIVQEDFVDAYRNLSYKGIAGLRWVNRNCKQARFVFKADDDVFVNMPALLQHLWTLDKADKGQGLLLCRTWWKMHVLRGQDKWALSEAEYPLEFYPPYCSGLAFTMSMDVAMKILNVAPYVPFLWIDDAFITGLLPYKAGISHTQFLHTYITPPDLQCYRQPTWYRCLFMHLGEVDTYMVTWENLLQTARKYPIPQVAKVVPGLIAGNNDTQSVVQPPTDIRKIDFDKYLNKDQS